MQEEVVLEQIELEGPLVDSLMLKKWVDIALDDSKKYLEMGQSFGPLLWFFEGRWVTVVGGFPASNAAEREVFFEYISKYLDSYDAFIYLSEATELDIDNQFNIIVGAKEAAKKRDVVIACYSGFKNNGYGIIPFTTKKGKVSFGEKKFIEDKKDVMFEDVSALRKRLR